MKRISVSAAVVVSFLAQAGALAQTTGSFQVRSVDFISLFNQSDRAVQPSHLPWAGSYFPYGRDGIADDSSQKPSHSGRYDEVFYRGDRRSTQWEKQNHACDSFEESLREGCRGWWGHCNAWAAAAIREEEPRKKASSRGGEFTVGDQKAYLTELWMESGALFAGNTNKSVRTGDWIYDSASGPDYDAFWDVTPRAFFMILTNYLGLMDTSVVIDRFTGDEVWNHPLAGYRILPIRAEDRLDPVGRGASKLYPVRLRMKIYWTNDGVPAGYLSKGFDIKKTDDEEEVSVTWASPSEFGGRLLQFTLFFDAPVETNADGTRVVSAGRITGEGVWRHQEERVQNPNSTHPDFIWLPTQLTARMEGSANPHIREREVYGITQGSAAEGPGGRPGLVGEMPAFGEAAEVELVFESDAFRSKSVRTVAQLIRHALGREGVVVELLASNVRLDSGRTFQARMKLERASDLARIEAVLAEAGHPTAKVSRK